MTPQGTNEAPSREELEDPEHPHYKNAEVDNTKREWDSSIGDFRDNAEGHPPEWDHSDGAGRKRDARVWEHLEEIRKA